MTQQEIIELAHAQELPAWTMLKVKDRLVGWRPLTAHEICVLNEIFISVRDEELLAVGRTLGLIVDDDNE